MSKLYEIRRTAPLGPSVPSVVRRIKKGVGNVLIAQLLGLLRHILTILGGGLVASGRLDASELETGIGALLALLGVVWSWWSKKPATTLKAVPPVPPAA